MQGEIINDILVTDIADRGRTVGRAGSRILFIDKAVPGDVVNVMITKKKSTFSEARVIETKVLSPDRVKPFCEHFGICGGCRWQHLDYAAQLKFKQKMVTDALERIAKPGAFTMLPILGSESTSAYRNRLDFTASNKKWLSREDFEHKKGWNEPALGFHLAGSFDKVLEVDRCWLQNDLNNQIRNDVQKFAIEAGFTFYDHRRHSGFLRGLVLRNTLEGEWMAIVIFAHEDEKARTALLNHMAFSFPQITSLVYVINEKKNDTIFDLDTITYKGRAFITETLDGLSFRISPKSFFQTNTRQAATLYKTVLQFSSLTGSEIVYDLYSGTGTIANYVASNCRKVIGIDHTADAMEDARLNAMINGVTNAHFFAGDIKEMLTPPFMSEHGMPAVIVTDPPRAGMHEGVVRALMDSGAPRIVYVSCNPATQARDIALLSASYALEKVQPVDMFPHTHHVENVALLTAR